jgi:3-isopropylmalate/(R)-2-methylmalate dehydratase small subunit
MEDIDKNFVKNVEENDIIVAGDNFGCGSSREHAPLVIKNNKVSCVIAKSFARIFYRNAINIGLPIIECEEVDEFDNGDKVSIDFDNAIIKNITKNKIYKIKPFPDFVKKIISSGGLMNYAKEVVHD